jgi:uncharacterized membrane protein
MSWARRIPDEANLRKLSAGLAIVGIGVATYITIADAGGGSRVCLAGGHGCETVANSKYSHLLGANVAALGIAGYVLLLAAALTPGDVGRFAGFVGALVGFAFSLYLTYLELFVIDAVCRWCVASALIMAVLFAVNSARAFQYAGAELAAEAVVHGQ